MPTIKDAVIPNPTFEKVATYELPKDVKVWNEEIMDQFYQKVDYLPKEVNVDISVDSVDENTGYAKGSIVVWYNHKKINFPIIVRDYKLYPFDIFVYYEDDKPKYYNATSNNVKRLLMSTAYAKVENMYPTANYSLRDLKLPGRITPKQSIDLHESDEILHHNPLYKMSALVAPKASKEDIDHLKDVLEKNAAVSNSFVETTGDLINNIIELNDNTEDKVILDDHKEGKIDLNDIVKAKQVVTAIDSELFDTDSLIPIKSPSVCELRLYEFPSMEDFMDSGASAISRFQASKIGKPITGIVLDYKDSCDLGNREEEPIVDSNGKAVSQRRPQIFISSDGKYYSTASDCHKSGIGFYGSSLLETSGMLEKVVNRIDSKTTVDFLTYSRNNLNDKADKTMPIANEGSEYNVPQKVNSIETPSNYPEIGCRNLLCIYGSGDVYECCEFNGEFRAYTVNGTKVYVSKSVSIIPARIANIQAVGSVSDPVYKMIVGDSKKIFLVPERSVFINKSLVKRLDGSDFMKPGRQVRDMYEKAGIPKVSMCVKDGGYVIDGKSVEPLQKISAIKQGQVLNTADAKHVLSILGMKKEASDNAMKVLLNRSQEDSCASVDIYGVNSDYINPGIYDSIEKKARIKDIYKQIADGLKKDLIKEASVITDPESVDMVLSLNFINEDNLVDYIDQIQSIRKIISKLCSMLLASRMGLTDLEESAVRKSIDGLEDVATGLENVKLAIGK